MELAASTADRFLVRVEPSRGLERICEDVERLGKLDPKLRAAADALKQHFEPFPDEAREILAAVLWGSIRGRVQQGGLAGLRRWLDHGDSVLRTVEDALGTVLSKPVLQELVQQGTQLASVDTPSSADLRQAREEVRRLLAVDVLVPLAALAGVGAGALYLEYVEGYHWAPPPPPPPPPTHLEPEHYYP